MGNRRRLSPEFGRQVEQGVVDRGVVQGDMGVTTVGQQSVFIKRLNPEHLMTELSNYRPAASNDIRLADKIEPTQKRVTSEFKTVVQTMIEAPEVEHRGVSLEKDHWARRADSGICGMGTPRSTRYRAPNNERGGGTASTLTVRWC